MLYLNRKVGGKIYLALPGGAEVVILVRETWRGGAQLGVEAPADVAIVREEFLGELRAGTFSRANVNKKAGGES